MRIIFAVLLTIAFIGGVQACLVPPTDTVDNSTSEDETVEVVVPDDDISDTTEDNEDSADGNKDVIEEPEVGELPTEETDEGIHRSGGYGEAHIRDLVKNETIYEQKSESWPESGNSMNTSSLAAQNGESNMKSVAIALGGIIFGVGAIRYITMR